MAEKPSDEDWRVGPALLILVVLTVCHQLSINGEKITALIGKILQGLAVLAAWAGAICAGIGLLYLIGRWLLGVLGRYLALHREVVELKAQSEDYGRELFALRNRIDHLARFYEQVAKIDQKVEALPFYLQLRAREKTQKAAEDLRKSC